MAAGEHNAAFSCALSSLNAAFLQSGAQADFPHSWFEVKADFVSLGSAVAGARTGRAQGQG